jgi:hypothetical protein
LVVARGGDKMSEEKNPVEPLKREPKEIREIITRVLKLEGERLYQKQPHVNEDIIKIIKEEIR